MTTQPSIRHMTNANSQPIVARNSDDEESAQESEEGGEDEESGEGEESSQSEGDESSEEDQEADSEGRGETWEIEAIVARRYRGGVIQYQVKWLGFDMSENTWEPKDEIPPEVVKGYEAERRKASRCLSSASVS